MSDAIKEFESTLIEVFAELADLFGNPRSHGQVYGALFASTEPLTQEDIAEALQISPASVSLALRALESFGAVEKIPAPAARTQATYIAHTALRPLVLGFVQNRLLPKLNASNEKLARAAEFLAAIPEAPVELQSRLQRVSNWHLRARKVVGAADQVLQIISRA
jgi:DNA-binding transcriptional regulator GbsR (MarR family)